MKVSGFQIDVDCMIQQLLELDAVNSLKGAPETVLDRFCEFLFCGFLDGGLYVSPVLRRNICTLKRRPHPASIRDVSRPERPSL